MNRLGIKDISDLFFKYCHETALKNNLKDSDLAKKFGMNLSRFRDLRDGYGIFNYCELQTISSCLKKIITFDGFVLMLGDSERKVVSNPLSPEYKKELDVKSPVEKYNPSDILVGPDKNPPPRRN